MFHRKGKSPVLLPFILCVIAAFLLEAAASFYALTRGAAAPEIPLSGTSGSVEIADFSVEGNRFTAAGPEPRIVWDTDRNPGQVVIRFAEPMPDTSNVELLYSTGGRLFDRFRVTTRYLAPGTTEAVLTFPPGSWRDARLSFHDSFTLEGIYVRNAVPAGEITLSDMRKQADIFRFLVFLAILAGAFLPVRGRKDQGKESKRPRMAWPDLLRITAALCVILIHVVQPPSLTLPVGSGIYMAAAVCCIVGASSTPLFLLISGALLLPVQGESVSRFIRKRLVSVILPLLLYSLFYTAGTCATVFSPAGQAAHSLRAVISGDIPTAPHFWLVYVILLLYIMTVPLRVLLRALPEKGEKLLAAAILALLAVRTYALYRNVLPPFPPILSGWPGIFAMGYLLARPWMRKMDPLWITSALISLILSLLVAKTRIDYLNVTANCSILTMLLTGGMFCAAYRLEGLLTKLPEACRGFLAALGKQNYSILLIHYFVLTDLVMRSVMPLGISPVRQIGGTLVLCALLSFLLAEAVNRTALRALMRFFG